jgi:hypothetical protein
MRASILAVVTVLVMGACLGEPEPGDFAAAESSLTAAQRRTRAGQIRDAASANGMTQGYLLAGIADAETNMSQCWSELTWACQGPDSPDCGGPVVAGAGDGACSLMQGGLGMFQFDAGTYSDTLAREGDRVLTVAGNTAAAVDFVVAMVIRSVHISGVDTRDQAIAWLNGVRIDNAQWDAWITTVTHYYNGCAPGASCFDSRYASYRDHTVNVYNEMGASFWATSTYGAAFSAQSFPYASDPFPLEGGTEMGGYLEMRNTGTETWHPGQTFLGTTEPRDVASPIQGHDWVSPNRAATIDHDVAPGETGRFNFSVRAPTTPGDYDQFFNLVEEGVTWFSDSGGPIDHQIEIRVTATPSTAPPCPTGIGADWSCDGSDRVMCTAGMVMRETCAHGCTAGACDPAPSTDVDGDGFVADDCDDMDPSVHPGATEVCGDGIDQDCDGADLACGGGDGGVVSHPDGGVVHGDGGAIGMPPRGGIESGGCSVSRGRGASSIPWLGLAIAALAIRARRARAAISR